MELHQLFAGLLTAIAVNTAAIIYLAYRLQKAYRYIYYLHLKRGNDKEEQLQIVAEMQQLLKVIRQTHVALLQQNGVDSGEIVDRYQKSLN
jgi:hypothetical protein